MQHRRLRVDRHRGNRAGRGRGGVRGDCVRLKPRQPGHENPSGNARARLSRSGEAPPDGRGEAARASGCRDLHPPRTGAPLMAQVPPTRLDKPVALRASHLLRDFTDVGVKILAEIASQRSVGKGTYAFKAGEASSTITFVA